VAAGGFFEGVFGVSRRAGEALSGIAVRLAAWINASSNLSAVWSGLDGLFGKSPHRLKKVV
jgi:hypothetical protein